MQAMWPEYVSNRLVLRRFTSSDAGFVHELHNRADLPRFIPSAVTRHVEDATAWISRIDAESVPGRGWWCATLHDGTPVGAVFLRPVRYSESDSGAGIEIGWHWHSAHTGRGYATEAGELLLHAAFASGLERVIAVVDPENAASQAVCRKIGLRSAGRTTQYYDTELDVFEATSSTVSRQITWQGVDQLGRSDHADVLLDDGLFAVGHQTTGTYRAAWTVDARHGWITRSVAVAVTGDGWTRTLSLTRDPTNGQWASTAQAAGAAPAGLPAPGITNPQSLDDALDCDLGLCPLTNTIPVRRLGLLEPGTLSHDLTMAWIAMPSLAVTPSRQAYAPGASGHVTYTSGSRQTEYDLALDDDGLVLTYPGLAHRSER